MGKTNIKQLLQLQSVLFANAEGIESLDSNLVQSIIDRNREAGRDFMTWLRDGGKMIIGEPKIIQIDRTQPFDVKKFLGDGWTIAKEDDNSLKLTELDLSKVQLKDMLKEGELSISHKGKRKRLKEAGCIYLDAKILQILWENQEMIPSSWKKRIRGNPRYIYFDGTILRYLEGFFCVPCLCWRDGRWNLSQGCLDSDVDHDDPSAVFVS